MRGTILSVLLAANLAAQLTTDQKVSDFEHLAALYAKNYAPYEWKRDFRDFDLYRIGPWLDRVRATKTDPEFFDVMTRYVAGLDDAHDFYRTPSNFQAYLQFVTDIYDGKVIVDGINRPRLPAGEFQIDVGDELVSIDGKTAEQLIEEFMPYAASANRRSTRRQAALWLTFRPQAFVPNAPSTGSIATVVIRRRASGALITLMIPWAKSGLPLESVGRVPSPRGAIAGAEPFERPWLDGQSLPLAAVGNPESEAPEFLRPLLSLQNVRLPDRQTVIGVGSLFPAFRVPDNFVFRLPRGFADPFLSGTFEAEGLRIGFIRIPNFTPPNATGAINVFRDEIQFMQANTDGLILDVTRNPGGSLSYVNALLQYVIPRQFDTVGFEVRATSGWVQSISIALQLAQLTGAEPWQVNLLRSLRDSIVAANGEQRGRTGPIPLDDVTIERNPGNDAQGRMGAYTKPLMVLMDEFSASGGDVFPATIQDNGRGPLFGVRTMGAGGSVGSSSVGNFTEGFSTITQSLMVRSKTVSAPGYPATNHIENVGVHPDIEQDMMTRDNLMTGGRPYMEAYVAAIVDHIRRSR